MISLTATGIHYNIHRAYIFLGLIVGRVTYISDKKGEVRHIFSSQFKPTKHIAEALDALKKLEDKQAA